MSSTIDKLVELKKDMEKRKIVVSEGLALMLQQGTNSQQFNRMVDRKNQMIADIKVIQEAIDELSKLLGNDENKLILE